MIGSMKGALAALILAGSFTVAGTAYAFESTPMERAELDHLSPQIRQDVEARMVSGQTVHGVLDTMLLNRVSSDFATKRIVATDFQRGDLVVEGLNGQLKVFPFDTETLVIHK
jgi:hypothetical protein